MKKARPHDDRERAETQEGRLTADPVLGELRPYTRLDDVVSYLRNKPESIHDTSYGASEPGTAVTPGSSPGGDSELAIDLRLACRHLRQYAAQWIAVEAERRPHSGLQCGPAEPPRPREDITEKFDSYS